MAARRRWWSRLSSVVPLSAPAEPSSIRPRRLQAAAPAPAPAVPEVAPQGRGGRPRRGAQCAPLRRRVADAFRSGTRCPRQCAGGCAPPRGGGSSFAGRRSPPPRRARGRRGQEREAAEARKREEDERRRHEDERKRVAEDQARRRLGEEAVPRHGSPSAPLRLPPTAARRRPPVRVAASVPSADRGPRPAGAGAGARPRGFGGPRSGSGTVGGRPQSLNHMARPAPPVAPDPATAKPNTRSAAPVAARPAIIEDEEAHARSAVPASRPSPRRSQGAQGCSRRRKAPWPPDCHSCDLRARMSAPARWRRSAAATSASPAIAR